MFSLDTMLSKLYNLKTYNFSMPPMKQASLVKKASKAVERRVSIQELTGGKYKYGSVKAVPKREAKQAQKTTKRTELVLQKADSISQFSTGSKTSKGTEKVRELMDKEQKPEKSNKGRSAKPLSQYIETRQQKIEMIVQQQQLLDKMIEKLEASDKASLQKEIKQINMIDIDIATLNMEAEIVEKKQDLEKKALTEFKKLLRSSTTKDQIKALKADRRALIARKNTQQTRLQKKEELQRSLAGKESSKLEEFSMLLLEHFTPTCTYKMVKALEQKGK